MFRGKCSFSILLWRHGRDIPFKRQLFISFFVFEIVDDHYAFAFQNYDSRLYPVEEYTGKTYFSIVKDFFDWC